jgi:nicotinamidase-related amidase
VLVSDMLVDFVSPRGKLFVKDSPQTIGPIRTLIIEARKAGATIIYIQDWHRPDDPEFSIWGPHAVQETKGTKLIPELAPSPQDYIVRKRTYDPFFGTDLDLLLRQKGIRHLVITGTVANICVLHAAGSADLRGYEVVVPIDTISALNPFDFQAALRQISFVYQGKLTRAAAIRWRKK